MNYQRSAADLAEEMQNKFGYVAVATDDALKIGEHILSLETTRGLAAPREESEVEAVVTGVTTYDDYEKQAQALGFGDTCTDCFKHYFKVKLKPPARTSTANLADHSQSIPEKAGGAL